MDVQLKKYIHMLFETKNYTELYQTQTATIKEMLRVENKKEFDEFLEDEYDIEEAPFWMYYAYVHGKSLLIGGYDEDVTKEVSTFLKQQLPASIYELIDQDIYDVHVDLGMRETIEDRINVCNQHLANTKYTFQLSYEETYCAGVYFVSVVTTS